METKPTRQRKTYVLSSVGTKHKESNCYLYSIPFRLRQVRRTERCGIIHKDLLYPFQLFLIRKSIHLGLQEIISGFPLETHLDVNITYHPQTDGQSERTIQT